MGVSPEAAAEALSAIGVSAVGANCGQGPAEMLGVCRRFRAATALPLWMKPNAGLPRWESGGAATYATEPEEFARSAMALVEAGASFIGGCCGTSPEYIRSLAALMGQGAATRSATSGEAVATVQDAPEIEGAVPVGGAAPVAGTAAARTGRGAAR